MGTVDDAVALVGRWVADAETQRSRREVADSATLRRLLEHEDGLGFLISLTDRVFRPSDPATAARHLRQLAGEQADTSYLPGLDRMALRWGGPLAPLVPSVAVAAAKWRLRERVGDLVGDARHEALTNHLAEVTRAGWSANVNLLGEEVHGEAEAQARLGRIVDLMGRPDVNYVSVKASAIVGHLDPWAHRRDVDRLVAALDVLYGRSEATGTFVNLDMESFRDLRLTLDAAMESLDRRPELPAGIVLQAYLPDSATALEELAGWARGRPGRIKVRLVKGANLSMERVEAEVRGWPLATVPSKAAADAAFLARIEQAMATDLRIGIASHNLFAVAHAHLVASASGKVDDVDFEMLIGMAPAEARAVSADVGGVLLYVPVVAPDSFDAAIAYLVRRFEENAAPGHFLRVVDRLGDPDVFEAEARAYREAVDAAGEPAPATNRTQDRASEPVRGNEGFANEPDTDPTAPANEQWVARARTIDPGPAVTPVLRSVDDVDGRVRATSDAVAGWQALGFVERAQRIRAVGDELARRRLDLIGAMVHEAGKPPAEADTEVSEAIDFARYYAEESLSLEGVAGARFDPLGSLLVAAPWNFPVAIPAGGVLAALAAGNTVLLKPAPETPRCSELLMDALHAAGIPRDVASVIRVPDDEIGRHLVTHPTFGGVILTGSLDTADLFRSWSPDLRLFAETSGKNSMVVTPSADVDLAVADLARSAFGHAGQKCSAASLAILVRPVDPRFRTALLDAVASLAVGDPAHEEVDVGLLISEPGDRLDRGLTVLEAGESWLLAPRRLGSRTWTPGLRDGVQPGSWYAVTECFGPVLGLIEVDSLDEAIEVQNSSEFGLTGGIHTLDAQEAERWIDRVEVGNAYVNRPTTGAIVRRQPFGGWKRSVVGPGAKAGGPNYVMQFGTWIPDGVPEGGPTRLPEIARFLEALVDVCSEEQLAWLEAAAADDERWWDREFAVQHDPSGLTSESNVLRYRPVPTAIRSNDGFGAVRLLLAALRAGSAPVVSVPRPDPVAVAAGFVVEAAEDFSTRLPDLRFGRVRVAGPVEPAVRAATHAAAVEIVDGPVTASGRIELRAFLREQAVSRTLHRYGTIQR